MSGPIDLKLLEKHARLTNDFRSTLACHRFDPHLQQPLFGTGALPKFSSKADGCRVWDILNNAFIDWTGGVDANLLGHRHPIIIDAISRWATNRPEHELDEPANGDGPFSDPKELLIANKLRTIFGDDRLIAFTRGRSEAVYSAIEIARTLTGRPMVAVHEVHKNRELYCEDQRFRFSRSHFDDANFKPTPYGDLKSLKWLLETNSNQFAAVFFHPFTFHYPESNYYAELRKLINEHGVLLVLDESETAFRLDTGGAQEHFSIDPDISIVGEKLGGPFAFSAVLGKSELLSKAWRSTMKTLDRPAGLTLDVVDAALTAIVTECLPSKLKHTGSQLQEELNDYAASRNYSCRLVGHPTRLTIEFEPHEFLTAEQLRAAFCMSALQNGVVTHGEFWANAAHDEEALLDTIHGLKAAMDSTATWISSMASPQHAVGEPFRKHEIRGRIDSLNMIRKTMVLTGWVLIDGAPVELSATNESGEHVDAEKVHRGDLEIGMPEYPQAAEAGFRISLEVESIKKPSRFLLSFQRDDELLYRLLHVHDPNENSSAPYPFGEGYLFT